MLETNPISDLILSQNQNLGIFNNSLNTGLSFDPITSTTNQYLGSASAPDADLGVVDSTDDADGNLFSRGTSSNDFLNGTKNNDRLYGLAGNDRLFGYEGDDLLKGSPGRDLLVGGQGNDTLRDDDGGDILIGGKGTDRFWLGSWDSPEIPTTITDFEVGTDNIKIGRLGETFDQLKIECSDEGAIVSNKGDVLAILSGVKATDLTAESFVFGDPQLAEQLQNALDTSLKDSGAPGATNAVVTPDGFVWKGAAGFSDLEQQTPMQPDDIFSIASVSKTFTAATVLKLIEQGVLSLDDTLGEWLPDVASNIPNGENITLRQILNGSSGIPNSVSGDGQTPSSSDLIAELNSEPTPEELVASIYGVLRSSEWVYPNVGNTIAGLIVEKATGSSFSSVLREQVLEPLGLEHTFYAGQEQIPDDAARGYADYLQADGTLGQDGVVEDVTDVSRKTISSLGAAGAVYSNAQDVAEFTSALFSGELLSVESLKEMLTFVNSSNKPRSEAENSGLGIYSDDAGTTWSKAGDSLGYQSQMIYFPQRNGATTVALANRDPALESIVNPQQPLQAFATSIAVNSANTLLNQPT